MKKALEMLYKGSATVYGYSYTTNAYGAETKTESALYSNIPCRLSYDTKTNAVQDKVADIVQQITMFCDPSYNIPAGSKIVITQAGATHTYKSSGLPAKYSSHQEINLTAFREKA